MHHYIIGGWSFTPDHIFRTLQVPTIFKLLGEGVIVLRIGIFTKLNFLATPPQNDMVDLNGIKTFFFI